MGEAEHLAGGEREFGEAIRARLREGGALVTLTGPPGDGRTLLAQALARDLARELAPGAGAEVMWEPADGLAPDLLPALAARLRRGFAAPGAPSCLVLTDWDRLGAPGTALVAGLLRAEGAPTILVTARAALGLPGEITMPVETTTPPEPSPPEPSDQPPSVDGLTPAQRAAAEAGYADCDRAEQLLWERLSVFEGSFGREAVREVCASGALPASEILAVLERLAPRALLPADGVGGEPGYWMPRPMRAVGAHRLTERGDRWAVVLHHRRWYVKVARRAAAWWHGGRQEDARALALRELPDLTAAMDPTTAPLSPSAEADSAVEIAVSLWFLWAACGRAVEGLTRLRHATALHPGPLPARALWLAAYLELEAGRPEAADPLLVQAWAAAVREGDDRCLALLAHLRGSTALFQGRTEAAAAEFREALNTIGDDPEVGPSREAVWAALALALVRTDPEAAQEALDRASGWNWTGRDVMAEAWTHYARAELHCWEGDPARAERHALRALRTHLRLGCVVGAACAAELVARLRIGSGRPRNAAHLLGAVDLLRASAFDDSYRVAQFCVPTRRHSDGALREALPARELMRAYEEGARRGLDALAYETP
ncbi:tetratricopeptide repeat protein [Streptomyces sp. NPDC090127]|uniref:tetratricopeptide repeat protein n=1 Tax=Streptomyces sp. NPDC090127 TaxID=3365953 RepID=UPI003811DD98